jgi:hypothetical protein
VEEHTSDHRLKDGRRPKRVRSAADFTIFWSIPNDLFHIMPRKVLGQRHTISIAPEMRRGSMWDKWRDRWDQLDPD